MPVLADAVAIGLLARATQRELSAVSVVLAVATLLYALQRFLKSTRRVMTVATAAAKSGNLRGRIARRSGCPVTRQVGRQEEHNE